MTSQIPAIITGLLTMGWVIVLIREEARNRRKRRK
jgi:hypothetical protein